MATSLLVLQRHHPLSFLLPLTSPTSTAKKRLSSVARAVPEDEDALRSEDEGSVPDPPAPPPPPKKSSGSGFGGAAGIKKKRRGKERGAVVRRFPIKGPSVPYGAQRSPSKEQHSVNENAFLLTWLGLGLLILIEGVALAASGFLPEEWDNFFVKYLYPSFTPTVFLFVGGTVAYGVFKYLQGEKMKS